MHLYRGAPCVRSWSKYRETNRRWTLCGIEFRGKEPSGMATEDPLLCDCRFCRDLADLRPKIASRGATRINRKAVEGVQIPLTA